MRTSFMVARVLLSGLILVRVAALAADAPSRPIHISGVENSFQVTEQILSGGQPEGDAAFAGLHELGVKTIISVDGTKPDVERAARFGMRYIHLPHGYDGIPTNTILSLIRAAQTAAGPIFVHCHHGKHRGPAAVGVICQATAGWTTNQVVAWLKAAGTAPDYPGLFQVNTAFRMPAREALLGVSTNFPARASVSGLVEAMVDVDRRWDHLKAVRQADWRVPKDQPGLRPAAEALLLQEAYRELQKHAEARAKGDAFLDQLRSAEQTAGELYALLKANPAPMRPALASRAEALAKSAGQQCAACHKVYRN